ncbi:MAG TPA: DUF1801 domain-containing protein [Gemmatimonadales bacterium]|jgi:hypothetical protein|nr:DUF1801 domain-containing protein [Gemmatimonadales bacterium]
MATAKHAPSQVITAALGRYDPAIVKVVLAARRAMRRQFPGAVELVYDNYNALVFAYGPSEHASLAPFSLAAYPRWVNLFFFNGASLPDPLRLLQGSGRQVRSIRLASAAMLEDPPVQALLMAAVDRMPEPFPDGRGRTAIRAIATQRRSRRPTR